MVYHTIVKGIARKNFELVNAKKHSEILAGCHDNIHHRFGGHHALGGERTGKEVLGLWFARLGRLAPGLELTVRDI